MAARLKRDDEVFVIRGRDKGRRGKVQRIFPHSGKVLVEGMNMVKRHLKAGAEGARQAGIIDKEMPMDASKLMPVCPTCNQPTRVAMKVLDDGSKSRVCKKCEGMLN
ncbi:MAG: 50S ribosomal protein L24 [Dehalococcoidia bacterium]